MTASDLIRILKLEPHPEGGFFKEKYRSKEQMTLDGEKSRNISTAIYFLLENDKKSLFHRIQSDELWFFHQGQALEIVFIIEGKLKTILLGNDLDKGESPQAMIPAHTWFAAKIQNSSGYALVSCTVAPGFDFADFELATRENLIIEYPELKNIIEEFT